MPNVVERKNNGTDHLRIFLSDDFSLHCGGEAMAIEIAPLLHVLVHVCEETVDFVSGVKWPLEYDEFVGLLTFFSVDDFTFRIGEANDVG